jgi:hypothetical protein
MDAVEVALVTEAAGEHRLGVDALHLEPPFDEVAACLRLGVFAHAFFPPLLEPFRAARSLRTRCRRAVAVDCSGVEMRGTVTLRSPTRPGALWAP